MSRSLTLLHRNSNFVHQLTLVDDDENTFHSHLAHARWHFGVVSPVTETGVKTL